MKIAIISGGPASEHDVSRDSADNVARALQDDHKLISVVINKDLKRWHVDSKTLSATEALHVLQKNVDVCLLMLHGSFGEDGVIQGALETAGIPYTGSGVAASALAIDKFAANLAVHASGLNAPHSTAIHRNQDIDHLDINYPVVLKPRSGGSTVGVSICEDEPALREAIKASQFEELLIQPQLTGRELTCGVVETSNGTLRLLPPSEVIHDGLFDYDAKYSADSQAQEITPAEISDDELRAVQSAALTAHRSLGCSGITRSDFFLDNNQLYYLETNTCPGMTRRSFIPAQLAASKLDMSDILTDQCRAAINRNQT